jgi:hypothetical protein
VSFKSVCSSLEATYKKQMQMCAEHDFVVTGDVVMHAL